MIRVGFGTACITPQPGKEIPGLFERRFALGVYDDLYARAVVVDDEERCVALVHVDAIVVPEPVVAEARKEVERLCGVPGKNCMIAATHTHSGGPICSLLTSEVDPEYPTFVARQIASAVCEASRRAQAGFVGVGAAHASGVAFNRRFVMRDGKHRTHPGKLDPDMVRPAGPEDATVTVVSFYDPDTLRPQGCIVNFACHATHMNGYLFSADYVKWVVDTLQAVYGRGFGVVYLNGACGDVTQVDNQSPRPVEMGPYWAERTGRVVGAAALQAIARTDPYNEATVAARVATLRAAVRKTPEPALKAARELLARKPVTPRDVETVFAREVLEVEKIRRRTPTRPLEVLGIRIADALFWGAPGELFQAFALAVRDASPFPHTCCVELAGGYNGYICTDEAFAGGGYEVRTARSSLLAPETGAALVKTASRLASDMFRQAEPEIAALPDRRVWPVGDAAALDGINQLARSKRMTSST